jgi:hypothetical protein
VLGFVSQPKKLLEALNHLPPTMHEIYDDIMQRIKHSEEGERDLALNVLSWVFHTANSAGCKMLNMDEILDLVATEPGDHEVADEEMHSSPEDVLKACCGLVVVDNVTKAVRFPHLTVLEYFRRGDYLNPISSLISICMTYLSFDEFERKCESWDMLKARLAKHKAAEAVANNWTNYARAAQEHVDVQNCIFAWLKSETKYYSMMQILALYQPGATNEKEVRQCWGYANDMLHDRIIMHVLARNGLDVLVELYLDGKSSIVERY